MRQIVIALFLLHSASTVLAQSDSFDVFEAGITDIQQALESGQVSSAELVRQYLARIETFDQAGPTLNSIVSINAAAAEQAMALDRERATTGPRSKMHGIPILVKDNYNVPGMNTSGGSVALANFQPSAASFQVQRLMDAGAIVLGKTNLHEFAYGITTVGSLFGQTLNPYDIRRVPGGSSGVPVLPLPPVLRRSVLARTPVAPYAFPRHSITWSGSVPPRACPVFTASCRSRTPRMWPVPWREVQKTWLSCWIS